MNLIETTNLSKVFYCGSEKIYAVNDVSIAIKKGSITSIVGPSGCGKTTLLNILGCLDNPTSGALNIEGKEIFKTTVANQHLQNSKPLIPKDSLVAKGVRNVDLRQTFKDKISLSESELTKMRRSFFGYVFQRFFLIPTLTVYENILVPSVFYKMPEVEKRAEEIIEMLGLGGRKHHLPSQLSTGQMQRVAIARAIINNPSVLLADEPTGNLDSKKSEEVKDLFLDLNKNKGISIIFVTHNPDLAKIGHNIIEMRDGKIVKN